MKAARIQAGRHAWRSAGIAALVATLGVVGAGTAAGQERAGAVRAIAALVGTPDRRYLWILSREPQLDQATYDRLLGTAAAQGFDVARVMRTGVP